MADTLKVTFPCSICGKPAVEVTLYSGTVGAPQISICSFMGDTTGYLNTTQAGEVWRALVKGQARALFSLDPLWIPSYCPECDRNYCKDHWRIEMQFDEDFPGFYDCSYGYCPQDHRRLIDD